MVGHGGLFRSHVPSASHNSHIRPIFILKATHTSYVWPNAAHMSNSCHFEFTLIGLYVGVITTTTLIGQLVAVMPSLAQLACQVHKNNSPHVESIFKFIKIIAHMSSPYKWPTVAAHMHAHNRPLFGTFATHV